MPDRWLIAHIEGDPPRALALLLFPPGAALEDGMLALRWGRYPVVLRPAIPRLAAMGIRITTGPARDIKGMALAAGRSFTRDFALECARDYLQINARRGAAQCLSVGEYAHGDIRAVRWPNI